jgi:MFS family permease
MGYTLLQAAVAWQVFQISGSALQLGLIGLMRFLPQLALTLLSGAVADAYDRRKIVVLAQIGPLLSAILLFALTVHGTISLAWIYTAIFFIAISSAFDQPARQALLPQLIPADVYPKAVATNSTIGQIAFVCGPIIGGILIARIGVAGAYATYGLLVALAACSMLRARPRLEPRAGRRITVEAVKEGLSFLRHNQVALGAMTLDMFAVLFGGAVALLPVYAKILHAGANGYGLLAASLGIGELTTGIVMLFLPPAKRTGATLLGTVAMFGLMTILFGISRSFPLSLIAYALTGAADQVGQIQRQAAIQLTTPIELQGRVGAVNSLFVGVSNQVGAVESGLVAAAASAIFSISTTAGAVLSVVSGGAASVAVVGVIGVAMPDLRRYRYARTYLHVTTSAPPPAVEPEVAGEPATGD